MGCGGGERSEACRAEWSELPPARSGGAGSFWAFSEGGARDRRVVRRSEALGEPGAGDWSGRFGGLGRAGAEVVVLEAVGIALEREDLGVVDESVDHRSGGGVVAEDFAPGREWLVAGDDQARALVAAADQHEHQVRGLRIER